MHQRPTIQQRALRQNRAVAFTPSHTGRRTLLACAAIAATMAVGFGLVACGSTTGGVDNAAPGAQASDPGTVEPAVQADDDVAVGVQGGAVPEDASPFDTTLPALARLDPDLLHAVQRAAHDAEADGIRFVVTSGWRSRAYQQHLFDLAVVKYGSEQEAHRYVDTPETSHHVTGHAVDIGPTNADDWLSQHGAAYGLCQTYANEMWHFELATAPGGTCPVMKADASGG